MYICIYVYMYICIYVYMYICIYVYVNNFNPCSGYLVVDVGVPNELVAGIPAALLGSANTVFPCDLSQIFGVMSGLLHMLIHVCSTV